MGKELAAFVKDLNKKTFGLSESSFDINKDKVFQKYANKTSPLGIRKKVRSTLAPYTGAFGQTQAIHLLRRAMFGAKPSDVAAIQNLGASAAVDALFNTAPNPYPDGLNWYENTYADTTNVALGQSWVNAAYGDGTIDYYRRLGLKSMWLKNMVNQNLSIQEKMVLFWYNLMPVQLDQVGDARFLYRYIQMLHTNALGNYKVLLKLLTKDGAMLYFLNGYLNNKYSPDENYARELQELFSVGKEGGQQFSENDVKEAAKVLTGWRVDDVNIDVFFNVNLHETSNKTFSGFYNGTTITGQNTTSAGDAELDELIDMILSGNSAITAARYICKKLYRFFVYYDIDTNIENDIINPLANTFIANNWNIVPVIKQLLKSEHFFDTLSMGCYIKTPIDWTISTLRVLQVQPDVATTFEDEYWLWARQYYYASTMDMGLGEVPNVSGYKAYYQSPQWHQLWINSNTFPKRLQWMDSLLTNYGFYVNGTTSYKADVIAFAQSMSNPADPDILISDIVKYMFGVGLSQQRIDEYKAYLLNNNTNNSYWTTAWTDYINTPSNATYKSVVTNRLRQMMTKLFHMAECHLS
jgi:uncharacterized protein (DUF1800 family)